MSDDTNVLRALDVTDLPPSKVDLRQAVRAGRRRERVRTLAVGGVTALVVLATILVTVRVAGGSHAGPVTDHSPSPRPATSASVKAGPRAPALGTCTFADLSLPGIDLTSRGIVTSPDGRVIVGVDFDTNNFLRFANGIEQRITSQVAGAMNVYAVNSAGDFLGGAEDKSPFVYRNHKFNLIPLPGGATDSATPIGLDDRGDALVNVSVGGVTRVAIWPAAQPAALKLLPTPEGWASAAVGIGADGAVAGDLERGGETKPAVWTSDGALRTLPVLSSDPKPMMRAINGDWVLARNTRWNVRSGSVEPITGMWGERLDKFGRVYGEQPNIAPPHPAVWVNGTVIRLPADPERPLGMMGEVSEDGSRITSVLQADNPPHPRPVVWTCH